MNEEQILRIENLKLSFHAEREKTAAVRGVSLSVSAGETLALVGESGCGKTALCRAVMMLHARHAEIESGQIFLCGKDVTAMTEKELETVRGKDAAMIFQDPMSSLNPVYSVGKQIIEPILLHENISAAEAEQRACTLLGKVGITQPELRISQYPHQFSGGMLQRVAIAIALACSPRLLIADEPTTALDLETQGQIVDLLKKVCRVRHCGMLFITHDLGLARNLADRTAVMKDGVIVETGTTEELFENPQHPYTRQLLQYAQYGKGSGSFRGTYKTAVQRADAACSSAAEEPFTLTHPALTVRDLNKSFTIGRTHVHQVLKHFSLTVEYGETVGLIGPSGCGKSTLARCLAGVCSPDSGSIEFAEGCRCQMIFQDSASAMNPRMTLQEIIAEPLYLQMKKVRKRPDPEFLKEKVLQAMEQAELAAHLSQRHPYDVSGGQRQRAAIARALITEPDFIIADEPISSLDVSAQAQIVQLLKKIRDERNLTMLLIAHDLPMAAQISDRLIEMSAGQP